MKFLWLILFFQMCSQRLVAAPKNSPEDKKQNIRSRLVEELINEKLSLDEIESRKRQLLSTLYDLNLEMRKVNKEKSRRLDEVYVTENKIRKINRIIANLEQAISVYRSKLKVQLRTAIQISDSGTLRLLFSSKSSTELDRDLKFLKILIDHNYKGIKDYEKLVVAQNQQKKALNAVMAKLNLLKETIKKKEAFIVARQSEKKQIITKLERDRKIQITNIGGLRERTASSFENKGVDAQLAELLQTSFFENHGKLEAPVHGEVIQDYGSIKDDLYNVSLSSKGLFYSASVSEKVKAVFGGVVEFVGNIKSFGKTVILNHGDHYYSVYSNLKKVEVTPGDRVENHQILAMVGAGGPARGSGIYFEIRHFSEPENPNLWLRSTNNEEMP